MGLPMGRISLYNMTGAYSTDWWAIQGHYGPIVYFNSLHNTKE